MGLETWVSKNVTIPLATVPVERSKGWYYLDIDPGLRKWPVTSFLVRAGLTCRKEAETRMGTTLCASSSGQSATRMESRFTQRISHSKICNDTSRQ